MENKLKRNYFNKNNKAYYFPHDVNARNDEKILQIRVKYDWWGVGVYWAIIEHLRDASSYKLKREFVSGLSLDLNIDETKLNDFIEYCIKIQLFKVNDKFLWSQSLTNRMKLIDNTRERLKEAGRNGAAKRWNSDDNNQEQSSKTKKKFDPLEDKIYQVATD